MTLLIDLSPEIEAKLYERAAASGKDVPTLVREAVEEKMRLPQSFSELLAPIHEATRKSGLTEDRLADLVGESRDEAFAEHQAQRRP